MARKRNIRFPFQVVLKNSTRTFKSFIQKKMLICFLRSVLMDRDANIKTLLIVVIKQNRFILMIKHDFH
jgi:hypothetical protein